MPNLETLKQELIQDGLSPEEATEFINWVDYNYQHLSGNCCPRCHKISAVPSILKNGWTRYTCTECGHRIDVHPQAAKHMAN